MTMTCKICDKPFVHKNHLRSHKISVYQYRKKFGIKIQPIDFLMEKLECKTQSDLATLLNTAMKGAIYDLSKGIGNSGIHTAHKIIAILVRRMPEEEMRKGLREIRFMRDKEG